MKHYKFSFLFLNMRGHVEVFPAGAFVTWGGMGCHIDELRGPVLEAIFKARVRFLQNGI